MQPTAPSRPRRLLPVQALVRALVLVVLPGVVPVLVLVLVVALVVVLLLGAVSTVLRLALVPVARQCRCLTASKTSCPRPTPRTSNSNSRKLA